MLQTDGSIPPLEGGIDITQTGFRGALKEGLGKAEAKAADKAEVTPPSQVIASNVDQDVNLHRDGFRGTTSKLQEAAAGAATTKADQAGVGTTMADPTQDPQLAKQQAKEKVDAAIQNSDMADPRQDPQLAKEQAKNKASTGIANVKDKIPEKHKRRIRDETRRAKDFFNEEFPRDRRDQFVWRMKKVCFAFRYGLPPLQILNCPK